ncbi:MAG TPA: FAD-dependent monooxygenase [Phycisphaerae bacterium]|nr:FAD-dependent monooxygenase [Phycisphaerae bacterium]
MYDVLIIGVSPAGTVAAALLARQNRTVALVARDQPTAHLPCTTWVGKDAEAILECIGLSARDALGPALKHLIFRSPDLSQHAASDVARIGAHLTDRAHLLKQLTACAQRDGAELVTADPVVEITLAESFVVASLQSGRSIEARLLIAADEVESLLVEHLPHARLQKCLVCHQLELHPPAQVLNDFFGSTPLAVVAFNCPRADASAYVLVGSGRLAVGLGASANSETAAKLFAQFCGMATQSGLIPPDLSLEPKAGDTWLTPAGAAVELETHVAKRAILIGRAGGFVAAVSSLDAYPEMWSAQLAADVAAQALNSDNPQDELGRFDAAWRTGMARHLQPPNTDLQFLLPLVFSNSQMADRLAQAILTGQPI